MNTSRKLAAVVFVSLIVTARVEAADLTLIAPDGSRVTIHRDAYGVPHLTGATERGIFFGQGFAAAQDRLSQMEMNWRGAAGRLTEWLGFLFVDFDKEARTRSYTEEERTQLFNALPADLRAIFEAYRDGVNTYLDSMAANPAVYKPQEFANRNMERWTVNKTLAIVQYMTRNFGGFGGGELNRLRELQTNGKAWLDLNRPINDPAAPTTIPSGGLVPAESWRYSGITVRDEVIEAIEARMERLNAQALSLGLPMKLGSFAVLISGAKSSSNQVMLLGCPQMGEPQRSAPQITNEIELQCPTLHVGGMTIAGVPLVIIGHTEHHAWSLTSGLSDNIDVYVDSTSDASYNKYYHNGQWLDFEVINDPIPGVGTQYDYTHYRTVHGPVFADDLAKRQVFSVKMTFWKQELEMAKFIYGIIKAKNLAEFEAAAALNPMSFNLFYAGKDQTIKYWHTGKYQDRRDGIDPRLPHKGDGSEEWRGFIAFANLPQIANPSPNYLVNWNNKPVSWWNNGDNIPWKGPHRVTAMYDYVAPISVFTFDNLKNVPKAINSHGTYQQAIALSPTDIIDENVLPPGQSGFINLAGQPSPHFADQWDLHMNWQFKDMEFGRTPVGVQDRVLNPLTFVVDQNYPNPFNPVTTISYELPYAASVRLAIYNVNGQLVKTLVAEFQSSGAHKVQWNASGVSSGSYLYRLQAGEFTAEKKCVVLK
jgi:penicillin amidase